MKTVFVGLSGGVDSAVSAYLLKKKGYRVVGAFIKGWEPDFLPCTGKEDRASAMRVAAHLKIPFVTYALEEQYKKEVVDYFISEYRAGRTPNPDVMCNRVIKFGAFWQKAKAGGADLVATGHYAERITHNVKREAERYEMRVARDANKDQTYFLWTLTADDLEHSLFPIGGLEKRQVRALAEEAGLPNAKRPDSQGLCFLGHVDMRAFLKRYIPSETGAILDESGNKIGEHEGASFYTLGEHVPLQGLGARRYVVAKDVAKNTLTASLDPLSNSAKSVYGIQGANWISGKTFIGTAYARYRYRQPLMPVVIGEEKVSFETPQLIAPGQSCVFYTNEGQVLGGGIIL